MVQSANFFKRAQRGLYAGECIRFGDQVSSFGNRTRRTWKPNVYRVPLYSEALDRRLAIRVTPLAMGRIEQSGGLDSYVIGQRRPESEFCSALKETILLRRLQRRGSAQGSDGNIKGPAIGGVDGTATVGTANEGMGMQTEMREGGDGNEAGAKVVQCANEKGRLPFKEQPTVNSLRRECAQILKSLSGRSMEMFEA